MYWIYFEKLFNSDDFVRETIYVGSFVIDPSTFDST